MSGPAPNNERNRQILSAIVRAYIETGEPVSSRSISRRHVEALSSATIRNVMSDLEEQGFL
jgi:heat-inducible transcriptional repressor